MSTDGKVYQLDLKIWQVKRIYNNSTIVKLATKTNNCAILNENGILFSKLATSTMLYNINDLVGFYDSNIYYVADNKIKYRYVEHTSKIDSKEHVVADL